MKALPECINLRHYPWMRAQMAQWFLDPKQAGSMHRLALNVVPVFASFPSVGIREHDLDLAHHAMFRSIRAHGYDAKKAKSEPHHEKYKLAYPGGDIAVGIQDNGALYVIDGTHRIFAQSILSDGPIWARVARRSEKWLDFVHRVYALNGDGNYFYHPLPHPDFADMQHQRKETRFQRIKDWLVSAGIRSMTDYGACSGSFACECSDVVQYVQAVEKHPLYWEVAQWRTLLTGCLNVFVGQGDIMTDPSQGQLASCLSTLHHVIAEYGLDKTKDLLTRLSKRFQFFLLEFPDEHEAILKPNPQGQEFARGLYGYMDECGWKPIKDFGLDESFQPKPARRLLLWGVK